MILLSGKEVAMSYSLTHDLYLPGLRKKIDAAKKEKEQKRSDESSDKKKEKVLNFNVSTWKISLMSFGYQPRKTTKREEL